MLTDMLAAPSHIMGPGGVGSRPCAAPRDEGPGEGAGSQGQRSCCPDWLAGLFCKMQVPACT